MTSSLVGSEMCIRDRSCSSRSDGGRKSGPGGGPMRLSVMPLSFAQLGGCLLYTSDAADDM
eukprot:5116136-Prorocentrum_lima.AAC.1